MRPCTWLAVVTVLLVTRVARADDPPADEALAMDARAADGSPTDAPAAEVPTDGSTGSPADEAPDSAVLGPEGSEAPADLASIDVPPAPGAPRALPDATSGRALVAPARDDARVERLLGSIDVLREELQRDRGGADLEMAVAVNLYVGGVMLSILSASLLIGTIFEGVCVNGVIEECTDGAAFLIGAIPSTLGALGLLVGAATTETRARARHEALDAREGEIDEAVRAVEARFDLALSPFGARLTF